MKINKLLSAVCLLMITVSCQITQPVAATSNPIGTKAGKSSGKCYFGMCFNVDASARTAALNGGITQISTVDYSVKNFLGIVQVHECIVTGN